MRDITPVAGIYRGPYVMEVNPSVPVETVPEFVAYARANPGKINMASAGIGTTTHMAGELFRMMTGTNMVHVPYRGAAPAITDLIGGQVQIIRCYDFVNPAHPCRQASRARGDYCDPRGCFTRPPNRGGFRTWI
jgi:hypothetical protein